MSRKNIYIDAVTAERLAALSDHYASDSEAIRVAVERLHQAQFSPTSDAGDVLINRLRSHLTQALTMVDGEMKRRKP